jgi:hypothetical protein
LPVALPMPPPGDETEGRYVLCFGDDGAVEARRGSVTAALSIQPRDVDRWRVYDDELFPRALKVDLAKNVSIAERSGETPTAEEALARMKAFLRTRKPDAQWTDVPFDDLFEAVAEINRVDDAAAARRARAFGLLIGVTVAVLVAWRVARWLALR